MSTHFKYVNGMSKERLAFVRAGDSVRYDRPGRFLEIGGSMRIPNTGPVKIRFIAHACVVIEAGGLRFATDPWLIGPCFTTGWWHAHPPKSDALELVRSCDFVYLSHNHPDHLHPETLALLPRDIPLVVPDFQSKSTEIPLRRLGFSNVYPLSFNTLFRVGDTALSFSLFKSGNFRDDSGLLAIAGDRTLLFTVDAAALNQFILPRSIDLLATSFAGGASGYPWCFEHYSAAERRRINALHLAALRHHIGDYLRATSPSTYMPYAGFFTEAAVLDAFIRENNQKNTLEEIRTWVTSVSPGVRFVNPLATDEVIIHSHDRVDLHTVPLKPLYEVDAEYTSEYVRQYEQESISVSELGAYFRDSKFSDQLTLYLQPTDGDFSAIGPGILVDFARRSEIETLPATALEQRYRAASAASR